MRRLAIVSIHFLSWLVIIVLPLLPFMLSSEEFPSEVRIYLTITYLFHPVIFYYFYLVVVPGSLRGKSVTYITILTFVSAAILLYIVKSAVVYLVDKAFGLNFDTFGLYHSTYFLNDVANTFLFIVVAILVRIAFNWYREKREKTELALEEHKLELELLKAQINPHFFFNTLNNIYSLVYKKSDDAPAAVMKLSEIMRYMIYESKSDMVQFDKEIEQLENYIELERLRIRDPEFIHFEQRGDFSSHTIPPMLLLSFAENAFKHGKRKVGNPGIIISVTAEQGLIKYEVINHILKEPHNNHPGEGIGMKNTRRRLELLYPGCHKLDIRRDNDKHIVRLILRCKS